MTTFFKVRLSSFPAFIVMVGRAVANAGIDNSARHAVRAGERIDPFLQIYTTMLLPQYAHSDVKVGDRNWQVIDPTDQA